MLREKIAFDPKLTKKELSALLKNSSSAKIEKEKPEAIENLGEVNKRPEVKPETKPEVKPEPVKEKATVCNCGGHKNVKQCDKCGWTWCDFCLKGVVNCPQCYVA